MRAALAPEQGAFVDDQARFAWARTARAAGKTTGMVSDVLDNMSSIEGWRGCYGALTKDSGQEQLWDELRRQDKEFGFGLKFHLHDATVTYPPTGGRLKVRDLANRRQVDKWRGKQYHDVYLDECQSMADEVLAYALVSVIPQTLARHRGRIRLGGTPRLRCEGWWWEVTSKKGQEVNRQPDGTMRVVSRRYDERDAPHLEGVGWSWSGHSWPRSVNPGLPDADRESDEMRTALAVTPADLMAIAVEIDGEWPDQDQEPRLYRFAETNLWDPRGGPAADPPYGLEAGHEWGFFLGADLAIRRDAFALELGACAPTHRRAYHCDEFVAKKLTVEQMAVEINRFRAVLGRRLKAIVGDAQGPKGSEIFEELCRVHGIPIEKAEKAYKDDGIELVSSDLVGDRMRVARGTALARQLRSLRRPKPNTPASRQPHQEDDAADAWLYARRRMTHGFAKAAGTPKTDEELRVAAHVRQLRAIDARARRGADPLGALRGGPAPRGRPW